MSEFPSPSWLHSDQAKALQGLVDLVADVVADLEANSDPVPGPITERRFSASSMCAFPSPFTVNWLSPQHKKASA